VLSPCCTSIRTLRGDSHWLIVPPSTLWGTPPFLPPKIASSSRRCSAVAPASTYRRAFPLPDQKSPGHSAARADLAPGEIDTIGGPLTNVEDQGATTPALIGLGRSEPAATHHVAVAELDQLAAHVPDHALPPVVRWLAS
jgi:hypothetical protein